jgi:hypothetical protein
VAALAADRDSGGDCDGNRPRLGNWEREGRAGEVGETVGRGGGGGGRFGGGRRV